MRRICCLLLLLGSSMALGQDTSPQPQLADPASFDTKRACLSECEGVFRDCQADCEDTEARTREPHYESPDLPVDDCIDDCQRDLKLCNEDC